MTRKIPATSPKPLPSPLAMSTASTEPTPSPVPHRPKAQAPPPQKPIPKPQPKLPSLKKLRFQCSDLSHDGARLFFSNLDPSLELSKAVDTVLSTLYAPAASNSHIPPVRSVTLLLEAMDGVAYTKGMDLDNDHKEIHLCLDHVSRSFHGDGKVLKHEICGVLVHEMVHCWQWNGKGTCPGGLIEGIADFVRLRASLGAAHWEKKKGGNWDAGYQQTGYFLDWIEKTRGEGSIRRINGALQHMKYDEDCFWGDLFGKGVHAMWDEYQATFEDTETNEAGGY